MKKVFSIFLFVIGSQMLLAHPGTGHHSHDSFVGEWAWLILPLAAMIAIVWKFNRTRLKNTGK